MKWKLVVYRGFRGSGFPKIKGTILGVLIIRVIIFWGLYWGPLFWETTKSQFARKKLDKVQKKVRKQQSPMLGILRQLLHLRIRGRVPTSLRAVLTQMEFLAALPRPCRALASCPPVNLKILVM